MGLLDIFRRVEGIGAAEVAEIATGKGKKGYLLLDVRQPREHEDGHIKGSRLIPLPELSMRAHELPRDKTIIVYCLSGARSLWAAKKLKGMGFQNVLNMRGGIMALGR